VCGAAARTRLAASPNWKAPIAVVATLAALALGVIAAALVKLAGDTGPAPAPITRTVTTTAAALAPTSTAPAAAPTTPFAPAGALPGAGNVAKAKARARAKAFTLPGLTGGARTPRSTGSSPPSTRPGPITPSRLKQLERLNLSGGVK